MDFIDEVRALSAQFKARIKHMGTEEATKQFLVLPFVRMMGYDTEDPTEVVPEFAADIGRKGAKVDYALVRDGKPSILIEAKRYGVPLEVAQESQLFWYFHATEVRFTILTDGINYKFYADLDKLNVMDNRPFLEFNMVDFTDAQVAELKRFTKPSFNPKTCVEAAREMKYMNQIKEVLQSEMQDPSKEFVHFVLGSIDFGGNKTEQTIARFKRRVHRAFGEFVNGYVDSRIKTALAPSGQNPVADGPVPGKPSEVGELHLNSRGAKARGWWNEGDNSLAVQAGATVAKHPVKSLSKGHTKLRKAMLDDGRLVDEGHAYRLTQDVTFTSPSAAASVMAAMDHAGPLVWKDAEGRRLRDLPAWKER